MIFKQQKGQGLVEYALILVLIAMVVIVVLGLFGPAIGEVFSEVVDALEQVSAHEEAPPDCYGSYLLPLMLSGASLSFWVSNRLAARQAAQKLQAS